MKIYIIEHCIAYEFTQPLQGYVSKVKAEEVLSKLDELKEKYARVREDGDAETRKVIEKQMQDICPALGDAGDEDKVSFPYGEWECFNIAEVDILDLEV